MTLHHTIRHRAFDTPPPERVFTRHGYGQVATGKSPEEATQALWEKIRQAREA